MRFTTAAAVLTLAACAYPGAVEDPVGRKLTWFSFLNGDDLRRSCTENAPDRFRLVFNADYNEHVRVYEVVGEADGAPDDRGAVIEARVLQAADLSRVDLSDPLGPWRGAASRQRLSPRQYTLFLAALAASGAFDREPATVRLPSNGFYWLVNGCHGGRWFFTAYPYPSDRFADIRFVEPLAGADSTGVPFPTLPPPGDAPRQLPTPAERETGVYFEVEAGADGLVGPSHVFGPWLIGVLTPPPP